MTVQRRWRWLDKIIAHISINLKYKSLIYLRQPWLQFARIPYSRVDATAATTVCLDTLHAAVVA